jgi:hypothetical protein
MFNSDRPLNMQAGKSDYAINAGDGAAEGPAGHGRGEGPPPQALMSIGTYPWWWREGACRKPEDRFTGLSFVCSAVRPADVNDGLAHTSLIGEKYLDPGAAETGTDPGDNENYLAGFNNDSSRSTRHPPSPTGPVKSIPIASGARITRRWRWPTGTVRSALSPTPSRLRFTGRRDTAATDSEILQGPDRPTPATRRIGPRPFRAARPPSGSPALSWCGSPGTRSFRWSC